MGINLLFFVTIKIIIITRAMFMSKDSMLFRDNGLMVEKGRFSTNFTPPFNIVMLADSAMPNSLANGRKKEKDNNAIARTITTNETGITNKFVASE